jgi:spore coat polysaccharide biosynthesis predicted glycosyltransferase SpsG
MMGAANTGGLLDTVIRALSFLPETIHHHIILGNAVHDPEVIQMNHPGKNFTYHYQPENIARIFASSDLAITSGGMSMCEACALGVPTLVLPQVPHEMQNARRFRDRGAVVLLDPSRGAGEKRIANTIRELVSNRERRKTLSDNARKMVDGRGLQRIVECLAPHWEGAFRPPTSPNVFRRPNPSAP